MLLNPNEPGQNDFLTGNIFNAGNSKRFHQLLINMSLLTSAEVDLIFDSFRSTWLNDAEVITRIVKTKSFH